MCVSHAGGMSTTTEHYITKINALVTDGREELIPTVIDEYQDSTARAVRRARAAAPQRHRVLRRPAGR
ncbi:MAG: hypothetical protein QOK14_1651 [Frankiaceae bacterium]|nr:hypothetical protein [Frankiaceae bacterium]